MEQHGLIKYFHLPDEMTEVEKKHTKNINNVAFWVCLAHIPLFVLVAYLCDTSIKQAIGFGSLLVMGPYLAGKFFDNPRVISSFYGFTIMGLGALLVHLGQGPVQIEMHFHFFASLALLTVWGNPFVIWVATVTVALHHASFWYFIPQSVFNYDAALWVVGVHALFVVVEAIAASYISRNFFDNVIGLEKIVRAKTQEVNKKNKEMRNILDNTSQGFLVINRSGEVAQEKSSVINKWFGDVKEGQKYWDFLHDVNPEFAKLTRFSLEDFDDDLLGLDYYIDSMPKQLKKITTTGTTHTYGFKYSSLDEKGESLLVVISDITEKLSNERKVRNQMEMINVFNIIAKDKSGFLEFIKDANSLVNIITEDKTVSNEDLKRYIHTLKGTSSVFKLSDLSHTCHQAEDIIQENFGKITDECRDLIRTSWESAKMRLSNFLENGPEQIDITKDELEVALRKIENENCSREFKNYLASWKHEPTRKLLNRFSEHAKSLASRLNKGTIEIELIDNGLRLDKNQYAGFWSVFNHVLRNSIDHGFSTEKERKKTAKLRIATLNTDEGLCVKISDNGNGIDFVKLAKHVGVEPSKVNNENVLEYICQEGVSTKDSVTDVSGRGVGMCAVKKYCDDHGISMEIDTSAGKGTEFRFIFNNDDVAYLSKVS